MWGRLANPLVYRQVINNSTSWTVPDRVSSAYVSIAGGGAGGVSGFDTGVSNPTNMISGARAGFLERYPVNLTPGEVIPIVIGAGAPPAPYKLGQRGGTTSFGSYLSCTGGGNPGQEAWSAIGNCGTHGGNGIRGNYVMSSGGELLGGSIPMGYGSGGSVHRCVGCNPSTPTVGAWGQNGVVIIDMIY